MKLEEIETFLTIFETNNILQASDKLYISQSTASSRIKKLEEELGYTLFIRSKGNRNIEITPKGEAFLPIARSFMTLMKDASQIKNTKQRIRLNIGTTGFIQNAFLKNHYHKWMENKDVYINIENHHSSQICELLEQQKLDLGFVTNLYPYPNIHASKIKEERLVILLPKGKQIEQLEEIHLSYSSDYEVYFKQHFSNIKKVIKVSSTSTLFDLLDHSYFGMIPYPLAKEYIQTHPDFTIQELQDPYSLTIYAVQDIHTRKSIQPQIDMILDSIQTK